MKMHVWWRCEVMAHACPAADQMPAAAGFTKRAAGSCPATLLTVEEMIGSAELAH